MLKHLRQQMDDRLQRRVLQARKAHIAVKRRTAAETLAEKLRAERAKLPDVPEAVMAAIEVLLLRGRSVAWVARETGASVEAVRNRLAALAIAAQRRRITFLAARLSGDPTPAMPDLLALAKLGGSPDGL